MNRIDQKQYHWLRWVVAGALFAGGLLAGVIIDRSLTGIGKRPAALVEKREGGYTFINPLLECEGGADIIGDWEIRTLRRKIDAYIGDAVKGKRAYQVSVYFRDLTNGPALGANTEAQFSPASLLKVPLMIAYLKMAESRPSLLKEQILYDHRQDLNTSKHFKSSRSIEQGKRYSIDELIQMMIVHSDNNAMFLLFNHLDREFRDKVYMDLGIIRQDATSDYVMNVEQYAFSFRVLFNASYLNRELSEQALRYLAQPDFPYGIFGGVPPGITVAQKYGERIHEGTDVKELHDCGIVYFPHMPYLVCVMTKGADFDVLAGMTKEMSAIIFNEISGNYSARQGKGRK